MESSMKKILIVIPVALVILAVIGFLILHRAERPSEAIRVSGNIEVTESLVSFNLAGRLDRRLVTEGETVTQGQVVAVLDKVELEQQVDLSQSQVQAAEAVLAEMEAGSRPEEIEQAAALLESARAEVTRMQAEYARQKSLREKDAVPIRDFESTEAAYRVASARVQEAQARWTLLKNGPRTEQIQAGRARLAQAKAAQAQARTRLDYATLASPLTGVVLSKGAEDGEYMVPGMPVIVVGELDRPWLRAYIDEEDLGRIKLGQQVRVSTDTYPAKVYEGRVTFISSQAEFTPKNVQTAQERVKLVYRIKVEMANPNQELKPGMPADAEILVGKETASDAGPAR
jgi:HlyD family secretion protein